MAIMSTGDLARRLAVPIDRIHRWYGAGYLRPQTRGMRRVHGERGYLLARAVRDLAARGVVGDRLRRIMRQLEKVRDLAQVRLTIRDGAARIAQPGEPHDLAFGDGGEGGRARVRRGVR